MQKEKALLIRAQKWGQAAPTAALEAGPSQQPGLPGLAPAPHPLPGTWPSSPAMALASQVREGQAEHSAQPAWPSWAGSQQPHLGVSPSLVTQGSGSASRQTQACSTEPAGETQGAPRALCTMGRGGVGECMLPTAGAAQGRRVQHGQEWNGGLETRNSERPTLAE